LKHDDKKKSQAYDDEDALDEIGVNIAEETSHQRIDQDKEPRCGYGRADRQRRGGGDDLSEGPDLRRSPDQRRRDHDPDGKFLHEGAVPLPIIIGQGHVIAAPKLAGQEEGNVAPAEKIIALRVDPLRNPQADAKLKAYIAQDEEPVQIRCPLVMMVRIFRLAGEAKALRLSFNADTCISVDLYTSKK
jgi:hypothetical protein